MGLAIPRPAIRAREDRVIKARIEFYNARLIELQSNGMDKDSANAQAFKEAKALQFTKAGTIKNP